MTLREKGKRVKSKNREKKREDRSGNKVRKK